MQERRIYKRTPIELASSFGISEDLPITQEATIVNISSGGFCFFSLEPIVPDQEVILSVELDQAEQATLKVRTVWSESVGDTGKYLIGVQIVETEGTDFDRFLDFYANLLKLNSKEIYSA